MKKWKNSACDLFDDLSLHRWGEGDVSLFTEPVQRWKDKFYVMKKEGEAQQKDEP